MTTCTPTALSPADRSGRRARVWLHCAEKFSWTPKHLALIPDHVVLAMYDVLWPEAPKPVDKPATTTTTTYPNATVTMTTTTSPNARIAPGTGMYWPMGSTFTTGLY